MLIIVASISVALAVSYFDYREIRVSDRDIKPFKNKLNATIQQKHSFTMNEVTSFEWDRMIVLEPYMSIEQMEKAAGSRWTTGSYIGYLLERLKVDKYPLLDDAYCKLVFLKQDQVVLDVTLDRSSADFLPISQLHYSDRSRLAVHKGNNGVLITWKENE